MAERKTSRLWSLLVVVAIGSTALSIMASSSEVQGSVRACCFDNADCLDLSGSNCAVAGGTPQTPGQLCTDTEWTCPLLCGGSAPECNGECETGLTCVGGDFNGTAVGGGAQAAPSCGCVPEIPQGGECEMIPDACAGGLPCEDGFCCATVCETGQRCDLPGSEGVCTDVPAAVPAASNLGLIVLVSVLIALGCVTLVRRRRLD